MQVIKDAISQRFKDKGLESLVFLHSIEPDISNRFNTIDIFAAMIQEDAMTRELLNHILYFEVESNRFATFKHAKTDFASDAAQIDKTIIFLTVEKGCN